MKKVIKYKGFTLERILIDEHWYYVAYTPVGNLYYHSDTLQDIKNRIDELYKKWF